MKNVRRIIGIGNSNYVVIPPQMCKELNLKVGDRVRLDKITKVRIKIEDVKELSSQKKLDNETQKK